MSAALLAVLVGLPAVAGASLAAAAGAGGRPARLADRAAPAAGVAVAAAVLALAALAAATRPAAAVPFAVAPAGLAVDALAALVLPTVAGVTLLVLVFAAADVAEGRARFAGLMLLFAAAVIVTVTATTLPALLVAWEVMGATSYALIGHRWGEPHRVSAGATAFVTTRAADLGLYAATAAAVAGGAGLALADLPDAAGGWRDVAAAGVLVAALGKAAQLPFSVWLSKAMEGPSPVSALLHSAAMVAMGGYLLLRTADLLAATGWAATAAAWAGVLTALTLGAVAVAQTDLKQLLAASTAAQLGFVVLAAGLGAVAGGAAHLVAHAATKAALFLAAGAWLAALGTKQLPALRGAARRWPVAGAAAVVAALALAGLPPLSLWATKDAVLAAAREESPALYAVGLAATVLAAAYAGKVVLVVARPAPAGIEERFDTEEPGSRRVGAAETAPVVVLAAGAAVLGLLALPPLHEPLARALEGTGPGGTPAPGPAELALSGALVLAVLAGVATRGLPGTVSARPLRDWLGLEAATAAVAVRPTLALARALARFDDRVLDRGVTAAARGTLAAGRRLAVADDTRLDGAVAATARATDALGRASARADVAAVDGAVEGLAGRVRALGGLARRPQTGLLHEYYLQAAAVLAVAVVLLVVVRV